MDTLASYNVGPGVKFIRINAPALPLNINVLEVDLKNPGVRMESAKSNDKLNGGAEKTSSMSLRKNFDGHYVIGAVNSDFFSGGSLGYPIQMQVLNGEILHRERTDGLYASVAFNRDNSVEFTSPVFSGSVTTKAAKLAISGVNESRAADKLVMYNSLFGSSTNTTAAGTEAALHPVGEWYVNDTVLCVVDSIAQSAGNFPLVKGCIVLSGTGTAAAFLNASLHAGDTVKVYTRATPKLKQLKDLVGGHPFIMRNGNIAPIDPNDPMLYNRDPRSLIGINKDTTRLYLVNIDGRQTSSTGLNVWEVVDFLKKLNVYEAMNFDGGGSASMVVRNELINSPSDGTGERPVGNSIQIVSTLKADVLSKINVNPQKIKVYKGGQIKFSIAGSDKNDIPVPIVQSQVKYDVPAGLGTIDNSGNFTAAGTSARGYIRVTCGNFKDSALVTVKDIAHITLLPKTAVADSRTKITMKLRGFDADNVERPVSNNQVSWSTENPAIGTVDSLGIFSGKSEGKTKVIAAYPGGITDTSLITVQIGQGNLVLTGMENLTGWKLTGSNIDTVNSKLSISQVNKTEGSGALKADYKFVFNPSTFNMLYLDTDIPVYGIPDTLYIDAGTDTLQHKLAFIFANPDNELFRFMAYGYINNRNGLSTIPVPMKSFTALGSGTLYFPIRLKRVEIQLQYSVPGKVSGSTYSGTVYLDNFRAKYPVVTSGVELTGRMPGEYSLSQNYPNPFNPSTTIEFLMKEGGNASLRVFDILGREVAVLVNGNLKAGLHRAVWNAGQNTSGIYFYRLQTGSYTETRKMMLVK